MIGFLVEMQMCLEDKGKLTLGPQFTLLNKDSAFLAVKEDLMAVIERIRNRVKDTVAEDLVVFNIDWIRLLGKP